MFLCTNRLIVHTYLIVMLIIELKNVLISHHQQCHQRKAPVTPKPTMDPVTSIPTMEPNRYTNYDDTNHR
eukprot:UN21188